MKRADVRLLLLLHRPVDRSAPRLLIRAVLTSRLLRLHLLPLHPLQHQLPLLNLPLRNQLLEEEVPRTCSRYVACTNSTKHR